jgi:hypothetical protein
LGLKTSKPPSQNDFAIILSLQKMAQTTEEQQQMLHDICCLWIYLRPRLEEAFPGGIVQKHTQMFWDGNLGVAEAPKPVKFWLLDLSTEKFQALSFKGFPRNPSNFPIRIFPRTNPSTKKESHCQDETHCQFVIGFPRNPSPFPEHGKTNHIGYMDFNFFS